MSQTWTSQHRYPRMLADVNGDGRADIVGFGDAGAWVSLATGGGGFADPTLVIRAFGVVAGWTSQDKYPRLLADVNGDGRADIIGFGEAGVYYAPAQPSGTGFNFSDAAFEGAYYSYTATADGWTSADTFPRRSADVTGDHRADLIGFGSAGVYFSEIHV